MTACAFRYIKADPVQRYALTDIDGPVFRLLIDAAERGLDDVVISDFDHADAAELTAILQLAREALGQ
ncbi:hypothetical protein ORIO_12435 [Cereibacter azotoformans]|uniref:hypothetical protein n=1 Tax=Cereibacter azotoformans TaxID=43057 RepID=UPI001EEC369D|nr:hypothetical protein [Cereibacter azotoformans]ULB10711.1 hypothetical protein ORIO_12435 [Cereibacter azotoformans]